MHIALTLVAGGLLLAVFLLFGWLWGANAAAVVLAAKAFMPVWLAVALLNMWVGVAHAGYSVREELPILLLVFAVPAVLAGVVAWQMSRG